MASITSLAATDTGPTSRGIINSNFTNINNELTTASSDIDAAQADITALETDKLDRNNQLRTGNGAWKVSYTNASGNETELALGAADTFLKSNGATSAPSFGNQSVDINGTTEDTTGDMDADFALVYDNSAGANRKQKVNVFRASDVEIDAGTTTTKFPSVSQLDKYSVSSNLRSDWYTVIRTSPIAGGGASAVNGAGFKYDNYNNAQITNYEAQFGKIRGSGSSVSYVYSGTKKTRIKWAAKYTSGTGTDRQGLGLTITAAAIHTAETDTTAGTVRFLNKAGVLWACNSNGSSYTATNIDSGITDSNWNVYEIIFEPGVSAKFYLNGTLVATHTTNLPTTGEPLLTLGCSDKENSLYLGLTDLNLSTEL